MIELLTVAILAVLAAFGWGRMRGAKSARDKTKAAQAEANTKLTEEISDAQDDLPDDIGVLRDFLRARDPGLK